MIPSQVLEYKRGLLNELTLCASFNLLASIEALLRTDFNDTIDKGYRDKLSNRYETLCRNFHKEKGDFNRSLHSVCKSIPLKSILDEINDYFRDNCDNFYLICSEIIRFIKFRNWYAHGRHHKRNPNIPDPEDLLEICQNLNKKILLRGHKASD